MWSKIVILFGSYVMYILCQRIEKKIFFTMIHFYRA